MGESTVFIEFMLSAILTALTEASQTGSFEPKEQQRKQRIQQFLKSNGVITNADVRRMFGVPTAKANCILAKLTEEGILQKIRIGKSWGYKR